MVLGLGGAAQGVPREDGFDITVASEVMAIFCLARDLADLQARLGRIIVGQTRDGTSITARDIKADGAMAALLRDALQPNLVQTLEGSPALVHGGPFANIAHGCNSVMATTLGLSLADVVVTEAGFGADLGAEKFLDIKCPSAGLSPDACVVVATVRALKMHGGVAKSALGPEDVAAVERGVVNLVRHVENMRKFGLPVVVALNKFTTDTAAEIAAVQHAMARIGAEAFLCTHWGEGAAGAAELARAVQRAAGRRRHASFRPLYEPAPAAGREAAHHRAGDLPRRRGADPARRRRPAAALRGDGLRPCAGLRRQDAVQLQRRSQRRWARRQAMCCRCARCGSRPGPASSSRSAATS